MDILKAIIDKLEPTMYLRDIANKFADETYSGELLEAVNELKSNGFTDEQIANEGYAYCVRKAEYYERETNIREFIGAAEFVAFWISGVLTASICPFKFVNRLGYGRPVSVPFCQYTERNGKVELLEGGVKSKFPIDKTPLKV